MDRALLREYQEERREDRVSMKKKSSSFKLDRYVKEDDYTSSMEALRRENRQLEEEVRQLRSAVKGLKLPAVITMPTQKSLSIPVATDEGGLGTTTRPQPGQVPVGTSNGRYAPGSAGGLFYAITTTTSVAYTALASDDVILANAVGGAITITLPTAVGIAGKVYSIKRTNAGANAVTVQGTGGQTIDGALTQVLTLQYTSIDVISDGANWSIL